VAATLTDLREREAGISRQLALIRREGPDLNEAARRTAAQAPPVDAWSQIRRRHAELTRTLDAALRTAREHDVAHAQMCVHDHRQAQTAAQNELTEIQRETMRRIDLPPDQRDLEQSIRSAYATSRGSSAWQEEGASHPDHSGQFTHSQAYQPTRDQPSDRLDRGRGLGR
jgi:hypothetical protein